jgi:lipoprotein-anchoring transpeptidase ErfK/SrfK
VPLTWTEGKGRTVFERLAEIASANRRIPATRATIAAAVCGAAALATGVGLTLSSGGGAASVPGQPQRTMPARQAALSRQPLVPDSTVPDSTVLATVLATVLETAPGYAGPGRRAAGTVPASWYGQPSVLPVIATRPGWVRVRLAQRPNESSAWLSTSDVTLSSTPYRIVVYLPSTKLALYDHGRLVFSAPAGVGTPDDPTPAGDYFVAFDEQPPQPNPGYGPFIIVTSAHSSSISDWEGSGDAVIGIHGPLGEDSEIGTTGARISHGCIRLHDQALEMLDAVPPGTPIDVVS